MSTRMIGGIIMVHGDDLGLRLPPKMAPIQVPYLSISGLACVVQAQALHKSSGPQGPLDCMITIHHRVQCLPSQYPQLLNKTSRLRDVP